VGTGVGIEAPNRQGSRNAHRGYRQQPANRQKPSHGASSAASPCEINDDVALPQKTHQIRLTSHHESQMIGDGNKEEAVLLACEARILFICLLQVAFFYDAVLRLRLLRFVGLALGL